jgi:hypothetical protein
MKTIIAILFTLIFSFSHGQKTTPGETKKAIPFTIYTLGGLKPYNNEVTESYQKKFNIRYHNFGCIAPENMEYYEKYNLLVFQHLQEKWGEEWTKDIRDNTIGWYKWSQTK